ncbi:MAG: Levanase precursor [Bacteroidota bacterium]|jgi:fructan beta-fructosidase
MAYSKIYTTLRKYSYFLIPGLLLLSLLFSCKKEANSSPVLPVKTGPEEISYYRESFRPQFHFSPEAHWMNDPNGLVYYKGIYHLFYQYYPEDIVWGPMHWGHATSSDLTHWQHQKIALFPDKLGYIFSGSVVVDEQNSSGLGTAEHPPMVAIFTYHNMELEKAGKINTQSQGLAYSLDEGKTWTKYVQNPIIPNPNVKDFRDPKVFWNTKTQRWHLTLVAGDHAEFYESKNLIQWTKTGTFGQGYGAHGGVWECPDLFKIPVEGSKSEKWVLLISVNPGAPKGGSGTQYFVGDFDGKTFTTPQKEAQWIDQGMDNYAGVTYANAPNEQRIFIGWMSNWLYGTKTPTQKWRSAMTLPRKLSVHKKGTCYQLRSQVAPQMQLNQLNGYDNKNISVAANTPFSIQYNGGFNGLNQTKIAFQAQPKDFRLVLENENKESLTIAYVAKTQTWSIDRSLSGKVNFDPAFAKSVQQTQVDFDATSPIDFELYLDWSSMELFLNQGEYCFTNQLFPAKPYTKLSIYSSQQDITNFSIKAIKSCWSKPKK